jgi:hypothetical protein
MFESVCTVVSLLPQTFQNLDLETPVPEINMVNGSYVMNFRLCSDNKIDTALKKQLRSFLEAELELRELYTQLGALLTIGVYIDTPMGTKTIKIHTEI